jgi:hypothetical protein
MATIAFQIEDRENAHIEALMDNIQEWSEGKGIEYYRYDGYRDDMVHYWWKVFKLNEIMNENPECEYIIWFDSDIYIYDFDKDPRDFMEPHLDFIAAHDPDDPKDTEDWFNAGVFCVRNNPGGKALIQKWMTLYDPSKWSKGPDGKWTTDDRWAGPNYEQGSFCEQILQKTEFKNKIKIYPSTTFNELFNWENPGPECFSVHLMRGLAQKMGIQCIWRHRLEALLMFFIILFMFSILFYLKA